MWISSVMSSSGEERALPHGQRKDFQRECLRESISLAPLTEGMEVKKVKRLLFMDDGDQNGR